MRRREFLAALAGATCTGALPAHARDRAKRLRVGSASILRGGGSPIERGFESRMAELGYRKGSNFDLEYVQILSMSDYGSAYREIVARKVDVVVAIGPEIALRSALAVAGTLPVVMIAVDYDPLARGYVRSLARPSGNVTGVFFEQIALTTKRLQLMTEAFPALNGLTVFWDRNSADQWQAAQGAAAKLGIRLLGIEMQGEPYDYDRAFARVPLHFRGGLMVLASPVFAFPDRARITQFALRHRLPTMLVNRDYVAAGGLMSYGPSFRGMGRRAAEYVDRIARGASPADLPVEQPTKYELVVNLNTAHRIGISLPQPFLLRADAVIE